MRNGFIILIAAVLGLNTGLYFYFQGKDKKESAAPAAAGGMAAMLAAMPPATVVTGKVAEISESASRKYVGRIDAIAKVELVARVSGYLRKVAFEEGRMVKKGQLLFQIEDTLYKANVAAAESRLKQANVELDHARTRYERNRGLAAHDIVSRENYEDAERQYRLAEARILEEQAALDKAKLDLSYTRIIAPLSGRIGTSIFNEGAYVSASTVLADIRQISPIHVKFAISESDFLILFGTHEQMKKQAVVHIVTADRNAFSETGTVDFLIIIVIPDTGTIMIWAEFKNENLSLIPGGLVNVALSKKTEKKRPAVIISALQTDGDGNFVYVIDKVDKKNEAGEVIGEMYIPSKRRVEIGETVRNMQVIESGLEPGEMVVVDGAHKIMMIPGVTIPVIPVPAKAE